MNVRLVNLETTKSWRSGWYDYNEGGGGWIPGHRNTTSRTTQRYTSCSVVMIKRRVVNSRRVGSESL